VWVVIDHYNDVPYGPFDTKEAAEDWLANQGIPLGQYMDQDVSVDQVRPTTERIPLVS
jgi:hypothetical protein